jgi:hypothetical protein
VKISAPNLKLDIAFWNYDRTSRLADGTVKIDGVDATFHSARIVPEIFEAMIRRRAYDVSELGLTYFLRTFDEEGSSPFLAVPVFPVRSFRHSAIYIHKASGIQRPEDLAGKRIGELALYGHDAQRHSFGRVWGKTGAMPLDHWGNRFSNGANRFCAASSPRWNRSRMGGQGS